MKQLLASIALLVGGSAHAWTVGSPLVELDTDTNLKGNTIKTDWYMNLPFAINDRYSVIPETSNTIGYRNEVNSLTLRHNYLRVLLKDGKLAEFGGWKMGITYRYSFPTNTTARRAGSWGNVTVRPELSRSWGNYSLLLRYGIGVNLITSQLQTNPSKGAEPSANTLGGGTLEIIQGYDITPELSVSPVFVFSDSFAPGKKSPTPRWSHSFEQYYEVVYKSKRTLDTGVGIYYDHTTSYGKGIKGKLFTNEATVGFKLVRNF